MAAPVVESAASAGTSDNALVIPKPTGTAEGDLLLAVVCCVANHTFSSSPSGWTLIGSEVVVATSSNYIRVRRMYKVAGASEGTDYEWGTSGWVDSCGAILRISGQHATTWDDGYSGDTGDLTSAAVTTTVADTLLVYWAAGRSSTGSAITYTPPSGMTEQADEPSGRWYGDPSASVELATKVQASAGSTGTFAATASGTVTGAAGLFAIAPAAGGGGGTAVPVFVHHLRQQGIA